MEIDPKWGCINYNSTDTHSYRDEWTNLKVCHNRNKKSNFIYITTDRTNIRLSCFFTLQLSSWKWWAKVYFHPDSCYPVRSVTISNPINWSYLVSTTISSKWAISNVIKCIKNLSYLLWGLVVFLANRNFLVSSMPLYKKVCHSVDRLVGQSVRLFVGR